MVVGIPGGKFELLGDSPREMDYPSSWDQLVSFVMAAFGVTKSAAGMTDNSAYSTLFASLKQLYWLNLGPKASRIARALTRYVAPFFGKNLMVEVRCKRIDDHEILFQKVDRLVSAKAMSKNELRKACDFHIVKEEWGGDMCGDPSPYEKDLAQQQEQEAQAAAAPTSMIPDMQPADLGGGAGTQEETPNEYQQYEEPNEVTSSRPNPNTLSQGALGPRSGTMAKRLDLLHKAKALTNGERKHSSNGKHK